MKETIYCPFCNHEHSFEYDDNRVRRCSSCNKKLEGENYLRHLVLDLRNAESFRSSVISKRPEILDDERIEKFFKEYIGTRLKEIKDELSIHVSLKIHDPSLKKELQKIRNLSLDEDYEALGENFWDSLEELLEWIDPSELEVRGREVATLITGKTTPDVLAPPLWEIKQCYQLGLYNAASVFCRTLLEVGIKDSLKKRRLLDKDDNVIYMGENMLIRYIDMCKRNAIISQDLKEKAHSVRKKANGVVHEGFSASQEEALETIRNTFEILEHVY